MGKIQIPKTKLKGNDGHTSFSIRMPIALCDEIDKFVSQTTLSRNEFLNILIREALKDVELVDKLSDKE